MLIMLCAKKMFQNTLGLNEWMIKNWLDSSNNLNWIIIKELIKTGSLEVTIDEKEYEVSSRRSVWDMITYIHGLTIWPRCIATIVNRFYLEGQFSSKMEVYSAYLQKFVENLLSRSLFTTFIKKKISNISIKKWFLW